MDLGIHERESTILHNIILISSFILYVVIHWSYCIINPCTSASTDLKIFVIFLTPYMIIFYLRDWTHESAVLVIDG